MDFLEIYSGNAESFYNSCCTNSGFRSKISQSGVCNVFFFEIVYKFFLMIPSDVSARVLSNIPSENPTRIPQIFF